MKKNGFFLFLCSVFLFQSSAEAGKRTYRHSYVRNSHILKRETKLNLEALEKFRSFENTVAEQQIRTAQRTIPVPQAQYRPLDSAGVVLYTLLLSQCVFRLNQPLMTGNFQSKIETTPDLTLPKNDSQSCAIQTGNLFHGSVVDFPSENYTVPNLWAQFRVQATLMQARVAQILGEATPQNSTIRVAVIDAPMSQRSLQLFQKRLKVREFVEIKSALRTKEVKLLKDGVSPASNEFTSKPAANLPDKSPRAHGSWVASIIAGPSPIGIADESIELTYFNANEDARMFDQIGRVKAACKFLSDPKKGITLINLSSQLSWLDQGQATAMGAKFWDGWNNAYRTEVLLNAELRELANSGCLVVYAAGNSAYRGPHQNNLNDALLRVSATDEQGKMLGMSSIGEVSAPGRKVLAFTEPSTEPSSVNQDSLQAKTVTPTGTSFAAPIVTAVAYEVARVLTSRPYFDQFQKPADRVALIANILKLSEVDGVLNGYEAIELANDWNQAAEERGRPFLLDAKGVRSVIERRSK